MLMRLILWIALLLPATVFLTGSWYGSSRLPAQPPVSAFTPQPVPLDIAVVGKGANADQLLARSLERLASLDKGWLKTKIRQTMSEAGTPFVASGSLNRGPGGCARLEMEIESGPARGKLVIVSDGETLAHVCTTPEASPVAVIEQLPNATDGTPAREECLMQKGCAGPAPLLRELREHLRNATLQTGKLDGVDVIRIEGAIYGTKVPALAALKTQPGGVRVYLHAATLWPCRLEWRGPDDVMLLCIEFSDAEVGRALTPDECAEVFTYRARGNEQVTEKRLPANTDR